MSSIEELPDWLRNKIRFEYEIEALTLVMGKDIREGKATDAEIAAVLYFANLAAPLDWDAGQVYLYVCTTLLTEQGMAVPEEIRVTELNKEQEYKLNDWKRQVYRKRGKAETEITRVMKELFGRAGRMRAVVPDQDAYAGDNGFATPQEKTGVTESMPSEPAYTGSVSP